ncbi:2687_t:CDS:2, partial [Funneliformis mosseae]
MSDIYERINKLSLEQEEIIKLKSYLVGSQEIREQLLLALASCKSEKEEKGVLQNLFHNICDPTTNPVKHTREIDDELYFSVTSMLSKKPDFFIYREDLLDYIKRPFISAIDIFQMSYDRYFKSELPQEILNNFFVSSCNASMR